MLKLRLDLERLNVDSFVIDADGGRGTVNGQALSIHPTNMGSCAINTGGCNSCAATCFGGACTSENNTYIESCLAGECPNSYDQACTTNGGGSCFYPVQPPTRTGVNC